jgi:uncharacterized protein
MSTPSNDPVPVSEEQVIVYLRSHPDFFEHNAPLLSDLHLRHESGAAISLMERQVSILRERNMTMRRRINELMQTAKHNDELFAKTRTLTLELLQVGGWHELNEVLATCVLTDFQADFVCCHVAQGPLSLDHIRSHEGTLPHERFARGVYPVCTTLRAEELKALFPGAAHSVGPAVELRGEGSAVLAPLSTEAPRGCLAIGRRDPEGFTPDMDTLFVTYIAEVLSRVIQRISGRP